MTDLNFATHLGELNETIQKTLNQANLTIVAAHRTGRVSGLRDAVRCVDTTIDKLLEWTTPDAFTVEALRGLRDGMERAADLEELGGAGVFGG